MHFRGNKVEVSNSNITDLTLTLPDGSTEKYTKTFPNLVIGNLMVGEKFIEAQGTMTCVNETLGISCEMKLHPRAWTSNWYTNRVEAMIK